MQEKYRVFTSEELVAMYQATQDEAALQELMARNSGLIYMWIMKYRNIPHTDPEDLQEEAYITLWRAAKAYDPSKGTTFTTLLKVYVQQTFNRLYAEASRQKRYSGKEDTSYEELEEINREKASFDDYSGLELGEFINTLTGTGKAVATLILEGCTNGEIARVLKLTPATVSYHFKRIQKAYISYSVEG